MEPIMQRDPNPYKVYVSVDPAGRVYAINSSAFIFYTEGWVLIDEGYGDRYHHAQNNYLPGQLMDMRGILRYMATPVAEWPEREAVHRFEYEGVEWAIYERSQEEMDADYTPPEDNPDTDDGDLAAQVAALQKQVDEQAAQLAAYEAAYEAAYTEGVNEA